jgi:hypothetical protein
MLEQRFAHLLSASLAGLSVVLAAGSSVAAGSADQAAAVSLFQEAKQLAGAGDFEHACPKFAEAQRLLPTTGTLLNLGNCYEKVGKLASAWGAFKQAEILARNAHDAERLPEATRRAAAVESSLSKLTVTVAGSAGTGMEVRRDGELLGEGQWGTAVPVDAGEHVIEVTAPGRQKWTTKVQVGAGAASVAVNVPELLPGGDADVKPAPGSAWSAPRIAGAAIGGAGLVALVVGALFGPQAISKNKESKQNCSPTDPNFCNDVGVAVRADAQRWATASTATIIAGGVLVAGGVVLFATAPSAKKPEGVSVEIAPRVGGLTLRGSF